MKYLVVDGELSGTGIWEKYEGSYLEPSELGLSDELTKRINDWLFVYWEQYYNNFRYKFVIDELDIEGRRIARAIKQELQDVKMEYFSEGYGTLEMIL